MTSPRDPWELQWRPAAEAALAELWLAARDRSALTEASAAVDAALSDDPTNVGESRLAFEDAEKFDGADLRVAFFDPLTVLFGVSESRRSVTAARVSRTRPGPTGRRA